MNFLNNNEDFTENEILKLVSALINYYGVQKYCKPLIENGRNYFSYSRYDQTIFLPTINNINSNILQNKIFDRMDINSIQNISTKCDVKTYKIYILYAIIHELEHANQQKKIAEDYKKYDKIYIENLISSIYNRHFDSSTGIYHDNAYSEYDANINAILKINEINKKYNLSYINEFNQYAAFLILKSSTNKQMEYESPLNQNDLISKNKRKENTLELNDELDQICIKQFTNAFNYSITNQTRNTLSNDLLSRLLRGDILTNKELTVVKGIANGQIITNDIFKTLERLNENVKKSFVTPTIKSGEIGKLFK